MVIDIDFFKKFNDTYGHLTGDKVLRHVARIFKNSVREQIDTVARYGGEEFGVILPETSLEGAEQFAERIRSSVENTKILEGDQELSITLSIGVACTEVTDCDKTSDLIEAADIALYQAKDDGRNQVKTYKESTIHNGIKE
jgi:diguanylate cyclase (GGDEF)-like protein